MKTMARFPYPARGLISDDYKEGDKLTTEHVKEIAMAPYVIVNAMHRSPLPELNNFAGIAQIPKKCIKNESCMHPTFSYLWNHILGNPVKQLDGSLGDFKTFLLDLNVRVDSPEKYRCEDLKVEITKLDGSPINKSNVDMSKFYELYSQGSRTSEKYPNHCRFYFTGSIKRTLEGRDEALLIKLSGNGLRTRLIEMKLKVSYSSFVDVHLIEKNVNESTYEGKTSTH